MVIVLELGSQLPLFLSVGIALFWYTYKARYSRQRANLPYPPGPKGYPIIGSLLEMPVDKAWLGYDKWSKTYGDMVYFEVLGQPFLVLGSLRRTTDLFERRSSIYSDRPRAPMLVELMGWGYVIAMIPYGNWWRRHRRAFHQHFNANQIYKYADVQTREARTFLCRLLDSPQEFMHHAHHLFAAIIMDVSYGISVERTNDPYIYRAQNVLREFAEASVPGRYLVDTIPALKYIPSWFPGAGWKRKAKVHENMNRMVYTMPFELVKKKLTDGTATPSMAATLLSGLPEEGNPRRAEEEVIARDVAAVSYVAGADTTVSTVHSFFLAMCLYPEVQRKAKAELDEAVGTDRLPEFNDRTSLPYINAIVKESNRWQLVLPLSLPHSTSEDDEYDGYFIPKGTIVMGNSWSILHDPKIFEDPMEYKPERYLKRDGPEIPDPSVAAFGFGRRICPGRHMSDNSLFITIASILAVFDITPALGEDGKPICMQPDYTGGLLSYPLPFEAIIRPRSEKAAELIRSSELLQ